MLLVPAIHVKLLDVVDAKLFLLQFDLVGVGSELGSKGADMIGKRGGKKDNLIRLVSREEAADMM